MGLFNFNKKKPTNRYDGKPFLKLVDSFVLKCINELDETQEQLLKEMEPKLQGTYNSTGTWDEIVMQELGFDENVIPAIKDLWEKNIAIAKENKAELSPKEFTIMFVDTNVTNT